MPPSIIFIILVVKLKFLSIFNSVKLCTIGIMCDRKYCYKSIFIILVFHKLMMVSSND